METLRITIEAELADMRLDRALSQHPQIRTRSRAARLIEDGLVTLNGVPAKASLKTKQGQVFDISLPAPTETALEPFELKLDIVFEDQDVIVINKPAGLVVHPAAGHAQDTLVNALLHHTQNLSMGFNEQRPGIVHRLDKDTSGLLVIAKNDQAHEHLSQQFKARSVHRLYWAIVFGKPRTGEGKITSRLARHPVDRKRFASVREGTEAGKLAVTNYKLLQSSLSDLSLMQLKLETGRTHQIRVHLTELGHPIVGDTVYAGTRRTSALKSVQLRKLIETMPRFALHAAELGFHHPRTGEWVSFTASPPQDLLELIFTCGFQL